MTNALYQSSFFLSSSCSLVFSYSSVDFQKLVLNSNNMATALGTTIDPAGISGSVHNTQQVQDTIPSQDATIAATTAIETVDFLVLRDWIFQKSIVITTDMVAGTILDIQPNHPDVCNQYTAHINQMMNAWTGGMHMRVRFMGTAFYGGSIRIGFLPPNLTESQIRTMSLSTLTAFPNEDLDPKNTNWITKTIQDERPMLYHWNSKYDTADRNSFGGYLVLYVAGQLVTQDSTLHQISIIKETAGNYRWDQPNPLFTSIGPTPPSSGPLPDYVLHNVLKQPLADSVSTSQRMILFAVSSITRTLLDGFFTLALPTKQQPWEFPGITMNQTFRDMRNRLMSDNIRNLTAQDMHVDDNRMIAIDNATGGCFGVGMNVHEMLASVPATNGTKYVDFSVAKKSLELTGAEVRHQFVVSNTVTGDIRTVTTAKMPPGVPTLSAYDPPNEFQLNVIRADESAVVWYDLSSYMYCVQTEPIRFAISQFADAWDANTSHVYELKSTISDQPVMMLRLNPNGMFTTQAGNGRVVPNLGRGGDYYLSYLQRLEMSQPLPPLPTNLQRKLARFYRMVPNYSNPEDHMLMIQEL